MATDQLREALEQAQKRAEKLSPDRQDNIAREILQKIEAAEWDEKWDETLASPESHAYQERVRAKLEEDIATGNVENYLTVDDLEKCL
jgi:hypothetical protein